MTFEKMSLNKSSPVPLYYQLQEILIEAIKSGKYQEGESILPEMELSKMFQISRPTVRQAINELVNEGYLYRIKGKGTFVARSKINQNYTLILDSYNDEMSKKGLVPKTKVFEQEVINASREIADILKINENDKVIRLKRLRYAFKDFRDAQSFSDKPIVLVTTYIPLDIYPELINIDFEKESLYQILEDNNLFVKKVKREFEARKASYNEAKLLDIEENDPVHYFRTIGYLENGMPIEYSKCVYPGNRNKFIIEISREHNNNLR